MTLRHPMYLIINNVQYERYETYSRRMCFYQENCISKISRVGTMRGVYYVHLERSNAGQNNVNLFTLMSRNQITIHADCASDRYQI